MENVYVECSLHRVGDKPEWWNEEYESAVSGDWDPNVQVGFLCPQCRKQAEDTPETPGCGRQFVIGELVPRGTTPEKENENEFGRS